MYMPVGIQNKIATHTDYKQAYKRSKAARQDTTSIKAQKSTVQKTELK